jgi:hypothetical protein
MQSERTRNDQAQSANHTPPNGPNRAALFVDFDNIYIGLDEEGKESFATDPQNWLARLCADAFGDPAKSDLTRRLLLRKCYINPQSFGRFRSDLMRAGLQVIDCPPLTAGLKTSADIYMAIDILDALSHSTHFDEFIIMSADADFTPVLLRLRAHDRRIMVVTVGYASPSYRAAADIVVSESELVEKLLVRDGPAATTAPEKATPVITPARRRILKRMADRLHDLAEQRGQVLAPDLPGVYKDFPDFKTSSNWMGFNTLRQLTIAIVSVHDDLELVEGEPWRVATTKEFDTDVPEADDKPPERSRAGDRRLRREIAKEARKIVDGSELPVPLPTLAHQLRKILDDKDVDGWLGFSSFGQLIRDLLPATDGLKLSTVSAGFLYDPNRHETPSDAPSDPLSSLDPALASLIRRISNLTDAPKLTPLGHAIVFRAISDEIKVSRYQLTRTSKAVRDRCIEASSDIPPENRPQISRGDINFILHGLWYQGHRFNDDADALRLAEIYRDNILALSNSALITLNDHERGTIDEWILSELKSSR